MVGFDQGIVRDTLFIGLFLQQGLDPGAIEHECREGVTQGTVVQAQVVTITINKVWCCIAVGTQRSAGGESCSLQSGFVGYHMGH